MSRGSVGGADEVYTGAQESSIGARVRRHVVNSEEPGSCAVLRSADGREPPAPPGRGHPASSHRLAVVQAQQTYTRIQHPVAELLRAVEPVLKSEHRICCADRSWMPAHENDLDHLPAVSSGEHRSIPIKQCEEGIVRSL